MNWRLKTSDMLNWHIFGICGAGPHVFAQGGKNLRIEYLEPSNAIHHSLQLLKRIRSYMNKERKRRVEAVSKIKRVLSTENQKVLLNINYGENSISVLFWSSAPL